MGAAKSKVAVTGAFGFVGSHLVERLLSEGHQVVAIDNMSNGFQANLAAVRSHPRLEVFVTDIESSKIREAVEGVDSVVHLAAVTGVAKFLESPIAGTQNNVVGTVNLLEACVARHVQRFVFASSGSVYGESKVLPLRESMPIAPISLYGASKAAGEAYCSSYADNSGLRTAVLRLANLYGPRRNPNYPVAVNRFARAVISDEELVIFGDGEQTRDFTSVHDVVRAIILAISSESVGPATFNIGSGVPTTINSLAEMFLRLRPESKSQIRHASARPGDVKDTYFDIGKARSELGYEPETSLESGLREVISWTSGTPHGSGAF